MAVKDFDAYWKEQEGEQKGDKFEFTVEGETFVCKDKLPASLVIEGMRMEKEYDSEDEIPESKMIDILEELLGKEQFERLLKTGIDYVKLAGLIQWLMEQLTNQTEEDGSGN